MGRRPARRAALPAALFLALCAAAPARAGGSAEIRAAEYAEPTTRYPHGALGDDREYGALILRLADGRRHRVRLPDELVFEDTAPRLADLDGDGTVEIITVESHRERGARLAVWGLQDGSFTRRAATDFIGQRFRWLAPVGAADLDGDGQVEIAYVETPHLGRVLKIVRLAGDRLIPVAEAGGLTNHRFGDPEIQGRITTCDGRPTILTADAGWGRVVATTLSPKGLASRPLAPYRDRQSFDRVPGCD